MQRALKGELAIIEISSKEEATMVPKGIQKMLKKFNDLFEWPEELPPRRASEHHIHLKTEIDPVNGRPYFDRRQRRRDLLMRCCLLRSFDRALAPI